jgi:hypothetical protein
VGMCLRQIGIDCNITLEKSSLLCFAVLVPMVPRTYFRIAQLQSSALFPSLRHLHYNPSNTTFQVSDSHIFFFLSPLLDSLELINIKGVENTIVGPFLAILSSQMLSRIVVRSGRMSVDILKKYFVHFKQLRSLELSDAVFMSDFGLLEVLGTLPSLENFTLKAIDPASHPADAPEILNSQSGGPKYFDALESLCVTGSFFLIQHLLGFIDSPWLKSIKVFPIINRPRSEYEEDPFTPSMTIVASKWSQSLEGLVIGSFSSRTTHRISTLKCLMLLTDFHEMQTFDLMGWKMENTDDDVRHLVLSWPKLRTLNLHKTLISLSTLRIIAENCPELRSLEIPLDTSTIPPFDTSSKRLSHNLEVLTLWRVHSQTLPLLERQIQVSRHLDLVFSYLNLKSVKVDDGDWLGICDLIKLCQDVRRV